MSKDTAQRIAGGKFLPPTTVTGTDGKQYPATGADAISANGGDRKSSKFQPADRQVEYGSTNAHGTNQHSGVGRDNYHLLKGSEKHYNYNVFQGTNAAYLTARIARVQK